jgi:hypothetical protein
MERRSSELTGTLFEESRETTLDDTAEEQIYPTRCLASKSALGIVRLHVEAYTHYTTKRTNI